MAGKHISLLVHFVRPRLFNAGPADLTLDPALILQPHLLTEMVLTSLLN